MFWWFLIYLIGFVVTLFVATRGSGDEYSIPTLWVVLASVVWPVLWIWLFVDVMMSREDRL